MPFPIRPTAIACAVLFATACSSTPPQGNSERWFDAATLVSTQHPQMRMTPAKSYVYAGETKTIIKNSALAERHHWVIADGNRVNALLIVQFEGFLEGVEGRYQYAAPTTEDGGSNYLFTTGPVTLGGREFVHNTWALDHAANARENPGTEAVATLALMKQKGLQIDDALIMSRFVLALGADKRRELIVFYLEPISKSGRSLAEFPDGGALTSDFREFSDAVTARSIESFVIEILSD